MKKPLISYRGTSISASRRDFIRKGSVFTLAGITGTSASGLTGCNPGKQEEEVSPPEDLMREHGVLNRLLLVYDHFVVMLTLDQSINPQWVSDSAGIIRTFIEEYHEKLEEDYLFPRFEKKGKLTDLVKVLREIGRAHV